MSQKQKSIREKFSEYLSNANFNIPRLKPLILGSAAFLTIYFVASPLIFVVWTAFWTGNPGSLEGSLTIQHLVDAFTGGLGELLINSFTVAIGMTIIALIFGLLFAWLFARTNLPTKNWMEMVIIAPYAVPGFIFVFMYIFTYGPKFGLVNKALISYGIHLPFELLYSPMGMIFLLGVDAATSVYLLTVPALQNLDASFEEVSRIHGASRLSTLRRVTFPIIKPAISAAILITFVRGLGTFAVVAILGVPEGYHVFSTKVWVLSNNIPPSYGQAAALSIILLAVTGFLIWYNRKITKRKEDFMTITGSGYQPRKWDLDRWGYPIAGFLWLILTVVWIIPALIMVLVAFHPLWLGEVHLSELTLQNFADAFALDVTIRAFWNSLIYGLIGGIIGTILVTFLAYYTERTDYPFRGIVDFLSLTPMAVPGIILGASVLFTYLWLGNLTPIEITGTMWIIIIGLITMFIPTTSRMAIGSIVQVHTELEESARIHGASWIVQMKEVFLPLFSGTIGVIFLFLFIHIFRGLTVPIMTYTAGTETVAVIIFNFWYEDAMIEPVAALSTTFIGILLSVLVVLRILGFKFYESA